MAMSPPPTLLPSFELGDAGTTGETARRALLGGIFRGSTAVLSCTGSTIAVRPDAPRQPGLLAKNAVAAGSVSLFAIVFGLWDGGLLDDMVEMPSPSAYSAGLTGDGRPLLPLATSLRSCCRTGVFNRSLLGIALGILPPNGGDACTWAPFSTSRDPSWPDERTRFAAASASLCCCRRSRRIIGRFDRPAGA